MAEHTHDPKRLCIVIIRLYAIVLFLLAAQLGFAQRGRGFASVEAHVGLSRFVYVGAIESIKQIEYKLPIDGNLSYGKPYRLIFNVTETIRGKKFNKVNLVLSLQHATDLVYFLDHRTELMLVGSSSTYDEQAEYGIEEQGEVVENARYSFRILKPLDTAGHLSKFAEQINTKLDSGKMFDIDLNVLDNRAKILKRAREFAKKHSEILKELILIVPNSFGVKCGYTNAFCGIALPICPETERTLVFVLKDPNRLISRVNGKNRDLARLDVLQNTLRVLAVFPSKENADLVRKIARRYERLPLQDGFPAINDIRRLAENLLDFWKL